MKKRIHKEEYEKIKDLEKEPKKSFYNYMGLGKLYEEIGNIPKAIENWKKAINLKEKEKTILTSNDYSDLSELYEKIRNIPKAIENCEKAIEKIQEEEKQERLLLTKFRKRLDNLKEELES